MHIPPALSENPAVLTGSSGATAPASAPAAGIPSFASFLSPHEAGAPHARAADSASRDSQFPVLPPPPRASDGASPIAPPDQAAAGPDKAPASGGKAADDRPTGSSAKKSQEHTLPSALCLALLGVAMPVTPEPVVPPTPLAAAESPAGNGSAEIPPSGAQPAAGSVPLAVVPPQIGVAQTAGAAPFDAVVAAAADLGMRRQPVRPLAGTGSSGLTAAAAGQGATALRAAASAAPRATADVLAKLGIAPSPATPTRAKPPVSEKSLPAAERSASVAGLTAQSPRESAALKSDQVSELLIRPTGPFTPQPNLAGTGSAQTPAMFHDAHAMRSDAAATSVFPATSVAEAAADPSAGAAAPAEVHAAAARAVEAVSVAVEHAARDRNSVKLDFDIAGERVAVVVERHADEIRATFKADSPALRAALSQQWQATAADRATSTVQPVFTDHASSHQLPDSQSRGFARQDNPSGQSGGEQPARGDVPRRRDGQRVAVASAAATAVPALSNRPPAFRPGSSLHLSTLA